jgi:ribosomal protein S18 acetylase RimI-like enzyme
MKIEEKGKEEPRIFIQGFATHPLEQRKGYASECLKIILKNQGSYNISTPVELYGLVDVKNKAAKAFFQTFGDTKNTYYGMDFDIVETQIDYSKINDEKNK